MFGSVLFLRFFLSLFTSKLIFVQVQCVARSLPDQKIAKKKVNKQTNQQQQRKSQQGKKALSIPFLTQIDVINGVTKRHNELFPKTRTHYLGVLGIKRCDFIYSYKICCEKKFAHSLLSIALTKIKTNNRGRREYIKLKQVT